MSQFSMKQQWSQIVTFCNSSKPDHILYVVPNTLYCTAVIALFCQKLKQ